MSLSVLLAINKAQQDDNNQIQQNLKQGFERIFAVLAQVSDARILCRLRFSANSRKSPKQPFNMVLQEAILSLKQLEHAGTVAAASMFVERARKVVRLINLWTKHQTASRLGELVEGVYHLRQVGDIQAVLNTIPNRDMDPSSRKNLLNIIRKVAKYREAARFLYRTAKRFTLVRQMKIVLINLPLEAFHKGAVDSHNPELPLKILQLPVPNGQAWLLENICRLLNIDILEASNSFVKQARRTLKEGKIHAEIQLLFHFETRISKLLPRVVCSSKDACFLCNAFILMHGKMHTPRYHGRLYPGWRLPEFLRADLQSSFNQILEHHIRDSLTTLFSRRQKTVYPDPNESTLLTLPVSTSTVRSISKPEPNIEVNDEMMQPLPTDHMAKESDNTILDSRPSPKLLNYSIDSKPSAESSFANIEKEVEAQLSNNGLSQLVPSLSSTEELPYDVVFGSDYRLIQGEMLSKSVRINSKSSLYNVGPLEVQIGYSIEPSLTTPERYSKELPFNIEWLTMDEGRELRDQQTASIIDAELLEGETLHSLDDLNCLYIAAQKSILRITFLNPKIPHLPKD
ncbi:Heterokaryon incompatibility protein [Rutstroemia sp. NJR-2017a WRK4]|nr:Heterokaryon incompatibility protein [Rutstroemia sp. NJR-2017a WRK4]